jgi:hypothetical protein
MTPEPIPTIAEVVVTILILYGALCVLTALVVASVAVWFWLAERREERADQQQGRYVREQTAVIDWLYEIPCEGEWPSWPTDRETA